MPNVSYTQPLPTRRRKDRDNDNDKENGLRMRNEREKLKEKRFSFFADSQKEKRYAYTQLAHCLLPDTQANASQKSKSQFFPTHLLAILLLFLIINSVQAQQRFRRHFIIAYDISTPFKTAEKSNYNYKNTLINLFDNSDISNYSEANLTNLLNEKKNGLTFFDPDKDEISFFHFNIARSEFDRLRWTEKNYDSKGIVSEFCRIFLKDKQFYWSDFYSNKNVTVSDFINKAFSITPSPSDFGGGVSMSNYVYPIVLSKIDTSKFTEEYVLIILSDFLTGSMHGNKMDFNRIRDIYSYSYDKVLPENSAPNLIKSFTDKLSAAYYKIDYFEFTFDRTITQKPISIIGYKVKPKAGNYNPEDVAIFIDSDIELIQRGYRSEKFRIPESYIRFTHNDNLKPIEVTLKISIPHNGTSKVLFSGTIAKLNSENKWISEYTSDDDLMTLNKSKSLYFIPSLKVNLDTIINKRDFEFIKFEYKVNTSYSMPDASPLNFVYTAERLINKENVIFTTKTTIIIMYYVIPAFLLLLIIIYMVVIGKPKRIKVAINGYLDSFETINYKKYGKLLTPYKHWDAQSDSIIVEGLVFYKSNNYFFNWKPEIYFNIQDENIPEGFDLFLKPNFDTTKEFSKGNLMTLKADKLNKLKFIVSLRQNDINIKLTEPQLIKFTISVLIRETRLLFIKTEIRETIDYKFHIGNDLGDLWVSFDPGTTGSCVAIGNHAENISVSEDRYNHKVIDSKLIFEITENYIGNNGEIPEELYKYGTNARTKFGSKSVVSYQSIKKLLGFKDIKEITFKNSNTLKLTGKELSSLLVKGLYKELIYFINKLNNPEFLHNGIFNPQRAVIAIPNNFTISKIQDMVDCLGYLKQFKEVRYVYEAEAVLFYYLSNYSRFNNSDSQFKNENILVFDMGGATINATIVSASKIEENQKPVYYIDFLGKIGYGIGGDTIDYCILKFIKKFANEYPQLNTINFNTENKKDLVEAARSIKLQIIDYYEKGYDTLITTRQLNDFLKPVLGVSIEFSEESKFYENFKKDSKGKYKIFNHPIFIDLIYNNVKDAVNEVIDLSDNCKIDKVIFSGRSTFFPNIKETVEKQLKSKNSTPAKVTLAIEESKTAVAHGACWYGINKNSIRLNNLKTNASFGIKQTLTADTANVEFIELIQMGCQFDSNNSEIDKVSGMKNISANFAFDGGKVNFYQVMGKNANQILAGNQRHKFAKIASIRIPQEIEAVQMIVKEDDDVECKVRLVNNRVLEEKGVVSDQEIADANEEHYTWIIN
jgi:molecular chaperone DnaK (HSP70)